MGSGGAVYSVSVSLFANHIMRRRRVRMTSVGDGGIDVVDEDMMRSLSSCFEGNRMWPRTDRANWRKKTSID